MFNTFDDILQQECQLDRNLPVLVGVSGGPDSVCLLHSLMQAGYRVIVAHFNHQLRPEATNESDMVSRLAQAWKVPVVIHSVDVHAYAQKSHRSIEEAARELRYQFLFETAVQQGAQAVAVGHNADDQVETVLMHLLRGAGPAGLRGMRKRSLPNPWSDTVPLVRPLLSIWRAEIETYITEHQLPASQDLSNLDPVYFRNQLRHQVIPYLQTLNPKIKQALWQTAELVGTDYDFLAAEVQRKWNEGLAWNTGQGAIGIKREEFSPLDTSVQRELLRHCAFALQPDLRDLDYATIQRALHAVSISKSDIQIDLVSGMRLLLESDRLWLVDQNAEAPVDVWPQIKTNLRLAAESVLEPTGKYPLTNGWELADRCCQCDG